jgi:hypothetical protein
MRHESPHRDRDNLTATATADSGWACGVGRWVGGGRYSATLMIGALTPLSMRPAAFGFGYFGA